MVKNGQDRYTTEVVLQGYNSTLTMLDSPRSGGQSSGASGGYDQISYDGPDSQMPDSNLGQFGGGAMVDDDIPF